VSPLAKAKDVTSQSIVLASNENIRLNLLVGRLG
jgi:hypothetical protein